jgi:16S rRNA (guanine527-N7)-methyltransferase
MNPQTIREILEEYFRPLPDGTELKVQKYLKLLERWGQKMPLTAVRDPEAIVRFHFGESIFALSLGEMADGRLADVGTGAGFPGLALKLARPNLTVTLIEPNKKKCAFLHEIIRDLEFSGVEVISRGFETSNIAIGSLRFLTSRALAGQNSLLDWAQGTMARGGSAVFWAGQGECDLLRANDHWLWADPSLIPGTNARFILRGKKMI